MGQGEPGFSYTQLRQTVRITDRVMESLGQRVFRHSNVGTNDEVNSEETSRLVEKLEDKGFQVKLFASFGKQENTACGLLGDTAPDNKANPAMRAGYSKATSVIEALSD